MIQTLIPLGIIGVTFVWGLSTYNNVVTAKQDIKNSWSIVKTEYQRRYDLIGTLVDSVKGHIKFEKQTFVNVAKARSGTNKEMPKAKEMKNIKLSEEMLAKVMVQIEAYPQLKANQSFLKLNDEIGESEDRINACRTDYNNIVRDYNVYIAKIPNMFLANLFKWEQEKFFELVSKEADKRVKINL
jgi:LemA protein